MASGVVSRMRLSCCTICEANSRSSSARSPPASVTKTLRGARCSHSWRTMRAPRFSRSTRSLRKICRRCSTRGPKCSSVGAMRARASMSSRTTSSEALLRQVKSAGQICWESCITRGPLLRSSMCTHCSAASSVGTYCDARWPPSVCNSVCISNCASCDDCSSARSATSAPLAASRISSSRCESEARIALSTCAQNGMMCSRPRVTKVCSQLSAVRRENLSCELECCTSTCTMGARSATPSCSVSRISRRNSERTEKVC
mmetsp:Transcript_78170/g.188751  ORF Transcript_78170/g.188751 Transcript_78170/m.188751 type:complete len:259 (-) Transcript_78170:723-1499(-)